MQKTFTIGDDIKINNEKGKNLSFIFCPEDKEKIWQRVDRLSQIIASYHQIANDNDHKQQAIITHVLNELIENAVKYSRNSYDTVKVDTLKNNDKLLIRITNSLSTDSWQTFLNECNSLFKGDLKEQFIQKIKSLKDNKSSAGIGLILLKKDFNTDIKFIFYEHSDDNYSVAVIAELNLD